MFNYSFLFYGKNREKSDIKRWKIREGELNAAAGEAVVVQDSWIMGKIINFIQKMNEQ